MGQRACIETPPGSSLLAVPLQLLFLPTNEDNKRGPVFASLHRLIPERCRLAIGLPFIALAPGSYGEPLLNV